MATTDSGCPLRAGFCHVTPRFGRPPTDRAAIQSVSGSAGAIPALRVSSTGRRGSCAVGCGMDRLPIVAVPPQLGRPWGKPRRFPDPSAATVALRNAVCRLCFCRTTGAMPQCGRPWVDPTDGMGRSRPVAMVDCWFRALRRRISSRPRLRRVSASSRRAARRAEVPP
jgi:hypothetical protein